jgi:hypothetical protein
MSVQRESRELSLEAEGGTQLFGWAVIDVPDEAEDVGPVVVNCPT